MGQLTDKITAHVVCAAKLTNKQASTLKKVLSQKTGKQVELSSTVDPSVIGGLSIFVDEHVIDYTIKKQMRDLKDSVKRRSADDHKA